MCNSNKHNEKPVVVGIVAEYNPLHNGHIYHIKKTKESLNPDYVVCVMSGNYTQRGEPALVSKKIRTKCALKAGIDCVIELPYIYATASAEFFSFAAVSILNSLGCVTHISFGCETPDEHTLKTIADVLVKEPDDFVKKLHDYLNKGLSFPAAREKALYDFLSDDIKNIMPGSNNILAIEYLKALKRLKSDIKVHPVKRKGSAYNDLNIDINFSSAGAIRNEIIKKNSIPDTIKTSVPDITYKLLKEEHEKGNCPLNLKKLDNFMQIYLRSLTAERINEFPFTEKGLANRLLKAIKKSTTVNNIVNNTISKRYPATRIQRLLLNIMSGLTRNEFDKLVRKSVPYARMLGFKKNKTAFLRLIKHKSSIPLISKTGHVRECNNTIQKIFEYEVRTTDIYNYLYPSFNPNLTGIEYKYQVVKE